ncbi:MAG: SBBP repeat-containing protein, partial [Bacteroidia bacterium]
MVRNSLFSLFFLINFISNSQTAGFTWAKSMGVVSTIKASSVFFTTTTNELTTGSFSGNIDFDPGPAVTNITSVGAEDVFISKIDAAGNFVWAKSFGGPGMDNGYGIVVDGLGDIYITGRFTG